jgi:hypothetical protein
MSLIVVSTRQHRLVIFLGLAFALSWWAWPLYVLDLSPTPFFACGPLVAALVVIAMTEGWSGYRTLGARMIHWLVGWRWWIVGLGIPLAPGRGRIGEHRDLGCSNSGFGRLGVAHLGLGLRGPIHQPARRAIGRGAGLARLRASTAPDWSGTAGCRFYPRSVSGAVARAAGDDRAAR